MVGFNQRTISWGKNPRSDVRYLKKKEVNNLVKKHFPQDIDEALHIEIIRYVDENPLAVEYDYIDPKYLNKISLEDITSSLSTYIQSQALHIAKLKKEYKAVIPNNTVSSMLQIPANTPVMRIDYFRYLENGDLLEYAKIFYNQTLFKFVQEIET